MWTFRMRKNLAYCLIAAAALLLSCEKDGRRAVTDAPAAPVRFEVEQEAPVTKALISQDSDLIHACTPVADGGLGKAIGLWAAITDAQGRTTNDVFSGVQLRWFDREGGHEYNPDDSEEDNRSKWNTVIVDEQGERAGEVYWRPGETYRFRAYYPAGVELRENTSASTFIADYRTSTQQDDMMAGYQKVTLTTLSDLQQHVKLRMKHMLSAVRVTVRFNDDFPSTDRLTGVWVENGDSGEFVEYGLLVFGDGTEAGVESVQWYGIQAPMPGEKIYEWTTSPGLPFSSTTATRATAYQPTDASSTVTKGEFYTGNDGYVLSIPQTIGKDVNICFTTENSLGYVFKAPIPEGTVLEPGYRYTFNIIISKLDVELLITIKPWNELESSYSINF